MGGQVNCQLPSGLSQCSEGKWRGQVNGLFPELTLKELVFLCHEYTTLSFCCNRKLVPYEIQF
jgi:hypothetical protein